MSILVNEKVLWFKVPIDNVFVVHVAERQENLTSVKHGYVVTKATVLAEAVKEFAATAVLEEHVDEDVVLKGCLELVDEGVVELAEDALLQLDVLNLFEVNYVRLANLLQRQHLLPRRKHLLHPPERSCSQCSQNFVF